MAAPLIAKVYLPGGRNVAQRTAPGYAVQFRGGYAEIRDERHMPSLLQMAEATIDVTPDFAERVPLWIDQCPQQKPAVADLQIDGRGFSIFMDEQRTAVAVVEPEPPLKLFGSDESIPLDPDELPTTNPAPLWEPVVIASDSAPAIDSILDQIDLTSLETNPPAPPRRGRRPKNQE